MKMYPISSDGISAFCTDAVIDPENPDAVYFLSVCGYQAAVKGIIANLLEDRPLGIDLDGAEYELFRSDDNYMVQFKKLPSGMVHGMLYPRICLPGKDEGKDGFFIFTRNPQAAKSLFFRHLDDAADLPLHPSWKDWLWEGFSGQTWLTSLTTVIGSYAGYRIMFDPDRLRELVSEALQKRNPTVLSCMKFKGGKRDAGSNFS